MESLLEIISITGSVMQRYGDRILFAYIFGSAAKGELQPLSDIDIAVYVSPGGGETYFDLKLALHAELCRALRRDDIDLIVLNTAQNIILLDEVVRHGAVLHDRDPEAREIFELKVLHDAMDFKSQRLTVLGV